MSLTITVDCHDDDFDWLRNKIVPVVENEAEEQQKGRLDHPELVEVSWEQTDA